MEMNTRLQVEHPVTEMITGLDLVEWQLRVAAGEPLPSAQSALAIDGHAIEARIYAEDPDRGFLPSIGRITHWRMPPAAADVRVDTGFREGDDVSPFYDPLLAKVIAWGKDREHARATLLRALDRCEVTGVTTNVAFLERVVAHDAFASGRLDTGLIDAHRDVLLAPTSAAPRRALIAAAIADYHAIERAARATAARSTDAHSPWDRTDAWWNGTSTHRIAVTLADAAGEHTVTIKPNADGSLAFGGDVDAITVHATAHEGRLHITPRRDGGTEADAGYGATVVREGDVLHVFSPGARARLTRVDRLAHADDDSDHTGHLAAPMSGTIVAVLVKPGDAVDKGVPLVVLEAMKMEHTIAAPAAGIVVAVNCAVGERVAEGADVVDIEASGTQEAAKR
jgi:3-methylcrotonyl-CoA carboxylase alpha subunit